MTQRAVPTAAYAHEMPRTTTHVCSQCGCQSAQWHGQCPDCGEWNTLVEEPVAAVRAHARPGSRRKGADDRARRPTPVPVALREVGAAPVARMSTGIGELDRVLGGGLVPGSLVLLGGSPGIGKSTLTNMVLGHLQGAGHGTLYVSGEESAQQVRLRAERLGATALAVPPPSLDTDQSVPVFDIVRVARTGDAVVAGRAAPGAIVDLLLNGDRRYQAVADQSGQFVMIPPQFSPGDYELTLRARQPDGTQATSKQSVEVAVVREVGSDATGTVLALPEVSQRIR